MFSWSEVHAFSQPLTNDPDTGGGNDQVVTYTTGKTLPVIILDPDTGKRRIVSMRWGWPEQNGNVHAIKYIHARSETIDERPMFKDVFVGGQRGIVVMRTFNEGRDIVGPKGGKDTEQWTIDPNDGLPRGFAFIWKYLDVPGIERKLPACVMVTVPPNDLITPITDRMPAILDDEDVSDDWSIWLGEGRVDPAQAKAILRTKQGVRWTIAKEEKKPQAKRSPKPRKPPKDEPPRLF